MPGLGCSEFERPLMDRARRRPIDAALELEFTKHLKICGDCRGALERQRRLSAAMGLLAAETAHAAAPAAVERAVLSELAAVRVAPQRRFVWQMAGGLLAASLALFWWFASRPADRIPVAENTPPVAVEAHVPIPVARAEAPVMVKPVRKAARPGAKSHPKPEGPFIAIPYTLPLGPYERADVVRMDMPVAALIAAGVPVGLMDPAARARTDVLIGQDGRARAVRLISVSSWN